MLQSGCGLTPCERHEPCNIQSPHEVLIQARGCAVTAAPSAQALDRRALEPSCIRTWRRTLRSLATRCVRRTWPSLLALLRRAKHISTTKPASSYTTTSVPVQLSLHLRIFDMSRLIRVLGYVFVLIIGLGVGYAFPRKTAHTDHWVFPTQKYNSCLARVRREFPAVKTTGDPAGRALLLMGWGSDCARAAGIDSLNEGDIRRVTGYKCCSQFAVQARPMRRPGPQST